MMGGRSCSRLRAVGETDTVIAQRPKLNNVTGGKWRTRFIECQLAGLCAIADIDRAPNQLENCMKFFRSFTLLAILTLANTSWMADGGRRGHHL